MTSTKFSEGELLELLEADPNLIHRTVQSIWGSCTKLYTVKPDVPYDCDDDSEEHTFCFDSPYNTQDTDYMFIHGTIYCNDEYAIKCDCGEH